jgi:hypothetical protein
MTSLRCTRANLRCCTSYPITTLPTITSQYKDGERVLQSSLRFQGAIRQELIQKKIRFAVKMLVFLYD